MYFGGYFQYGDFSSKDYNLVFAYKDTTEMVTPVSTKEYHTITNKSNEKRYINGCEYKSHLEFDAEIFIEDGTITNENSRIICLSLFNSNHFKKLKILDDNEWEDIHLNCVITLMEKIFGRTHQGFGVVGYKVRILCDAPFAWEDEYKSQTESIVINEYHTLGLDNTTDYEGYTYPVLRVKDKNNKSVTISLSIINESDSCSYTRNTAFNFKCGDEITLDGEKSKITHSLSSDDTPTSTFSGYFLRLVRGNNNLKCRVTSGTTIDPIEVTIEFPIARWIV